ncbi:ParA family protein [Spirosoma harenae]
MGKPVVIFITSAKGGSGKSSIAWDLAILATKRSCRVAILEMDRNRMCYKASESRRRNISLWNQQNIDVYNPPTRLLPQYIADLKGNTDIILVDDGFLSEELTQICLKVSDVILIPVLASRPDIEALINYYPILLKAVRVVKRTVSIGIVINRVKDKRNNAVKIINKLKGLVGVYLFRQVLHDRSIYERSFIEGLGICEIQGRNQDSTAEKELQQVFDELNDLVIKILT